MVGSFVQPMLRPWPAANQPARRLISIPAAGKKGFGSDTKRKKAKPGKKSKQRKKGSHSRIAAPGNVVKGNAVPSQASAQPTIMGGPPEEAFQNNQPDYIDAVKPEASTPSPADEVAFESRLAGLKETSRLLEKEKRLKSSSESPLAPTTQSSNPYTNPPSIMDTMRREEDNGDKVKVFGDSRPALLAVSFVLAAALLFGTVYVGDGGRKSSQQQQVELSKEERSFYEEQKASFQQKLDADPSNVEALEGAAVTAVSLGEYENAEQLLTSLSAVKKDDPDVWRLLAETRLALNRPGKAADAYREAFNIDRDDISALKGLAGALVSDGQPAAAVEELRAISSQLKQRAPDPPQVLFPPIPPSLLQASSTIEPAVDSQQTEAAREEPSSTLDTGVPAVASEMDAPGDTGVQETVAGSISASDPPEAPSLNTPSSQETPEAISVDMLPEIEAKKSADVSATPPTPGAQDRDSITGRQGDFVPPTLVPQGTEESPAPRLTAVEVELLLAKTYTQWPGHVGDAFAVYDAVITSYPEDFRGYLAKGVLLRNEGRKADADRAFLQARFLAPKELRSIVDKVAAPE